jgi:hypothetical protein
LEVHVTDELTLIYLALAFVMLALAIILWPSRRRVRGDCDACLLGRIRRLRHTSFRYAIGLPTLKRRGGDSVLELTCTNEQKIPITVNPVTAAGTPVELDGELNIAVQSGAGSIEMIDERSFYVVSGDQPGDTVFLVAGDADLGEGVETISDLITLHVEGAKAAALGLVAGEAVPK